MFVPNAYFYCESKFVAILRSIVAILRSIVAILRYKLRFLLRKNRWWLRFYSEFLSKILAGGVSVWRYRRFLNTTIIRAQAQCLLFSRVSHFSLFFLFELHPINHSCSWVVRVHKKKFSVIDQKLNVAKDFRFCTFYKGKMPKIGPKTNKIEIWPKSGLKVIISWNKSHYGNIWGMFEL